MLDIILIPYKAFLNAEVLTNLFWKHFTLNRSQNKKHMALDNTIA